MPSRPCSLEPPFSHASHMPFTTSERPDFSCPIRLFATNGEGEVSEDVRARVEVVESTEFNKEAEVINCMVKFGATKPKDPDQVQEESWQRLRKKLRELGAWLHAEYPPEHNPATPRLIKNWAFGALVHEATNIWPLSTESENLQWLKSTCQPAVRKQANSRGRVVDVRSD